MGTFAKELEEAVPFAVLISICVLSGAVSRLAWNGSVAGMASIEAPVSKIQRRWFSLLGDLLTSATEQKPVLAGYTAQRMELLLTRSAFSTFHDFTPRDPVGASSPFFGLRALEGSRFFEGCVVDLSFLGFDGEDLGLGVSVLPRWSWLRGGAPLALLFSCKNGHLSPFRQPLVLLK